MNELATAAQLVLDELNKYRTPLDRIGVVHAKTMTKSYGWVFYVDTVAYLRTHERVYALLSNGPVVFEKRTGIVRVLSSEEELEEYEKLVAVQPPQR